MSCREWLYISKAKRWMLKYIQHNNEGKDEIPVPVVSPKYIMWTIQ